mmetsp:Transcript_70559/g.206513  ORF Transcript_70559/g.206513 Transcript_70559/m.206513 type:complete len:280 (-) Transcript_70559:127-966(-)
MHNDCEEGKDNAATDGERDCEENLPDPGRSLARPGARPCGLGLGLGQGAGGRRRLHGLCLLCLCLLWLHVFPEHLTALQRRILPAPVDVQRRLLAAVHVLVLELVHVQEVVGPGPLPEPPLPGVEGGAVHPLRGHARDASVEGLQPELVVGHVHDLVVRRREPGEPLGVLVVGGFAAVEVGVVQPHVLLVGLPDLLLAAAGAEPQHVPDPRLERGTRGPARDSPSLRAAHHPGRSSRTSSAWRASGPQGRRKPQGSSPGSHRRAAPSELPQAPPCRRQA